jgi:hypothetical protein
MRQKAGPTLSISFLLVINTLSSSATTIFLSWPNVKLSATTLPSYCYLVRYLATTSNAVGSSRHEM